MLYNKVATVLRMGSTASFRKDSALSVGRFKHCPAALSGDSTPRRNHFRSKQTKLTTSLLDSMDSLDGTDFQLSYDSPNPRLMRFRVSACSITLASQISHDSHKPHLPVIILTCQRRHAQVQRQSKHVVVISTCSIALEQTPGVRFRPSKWTQLLDSFTDRIKWVR